MRITYKNEGNALELKVLADLVRKCKNNPGFTLVLTSSQLDKYWEEVQVSFGDWDDPNINEEKRTITLQNGSTIQVQQLEPKYKNDNIERILWDEREDGKDDE